MPDGILPLKVENKSFSFIFYRYLYSTLLANWAMLNYVQRNPISQVTFIMAL